MEHKCADPIIPVHGPSSVDGQMESGDHEQLTINERKHVMLSYNWNSQAIVCKIYKILKDENIPIWFDIEGDMRDNIYESMADGVENAAVICCFLTPDYQGSENCKLELQYAKKRGKRIIPCMLGDKGWKPSSWLGLITGGDQYISFVDDSEENIRLKTRQLIDRIKEQPPRSQPVDEPSYLFELVRHEYKRNNRIERIINPAKFFPIEQSYTNLAIVETKEQQEIEKKLRDAQHSDAIIGTFEQIYGMKTVVDVKDIFKTCNGPTKNVLVLGRAGIGKSTFCRYVAYQWATGAIWSQYDLLVLIPLRSLTEIRYPPLAPGTSYTLIDLVKKEYFGHGLSEKDDRLIKEQFGKSQVLWLLDGYDEIVQSVPGHLQYLFEKLLKTPHHILTSRPYLNTLSYTVQLEITGFTDDNIAKYVKQFFDQIEDASHDSTFPDQKLLNFLKLNPSIWGIAHIPINLELICTVWSDTNWSEIKTLTMTALYDTIIEWLCRRHLTKQNTDIQMTKEDVYEDCHKELTFLETLAFKGMENNTIILRKELLQKVLKETEYSSKHYARLLNIGILKSINDQSIGNQIEVQKDHYFIHLSFQEHFAARYLVKALNGPGRQTAIDFIKSHKYNQRFQLVFIFTCGLLIQTSVESCTDTFWDTILGEPCDLVGVRHLQLIISCMEEASVGSTFCRRTELMDAITKGIIIAVSTKQSILYKQLQESLRRSASLVHDSTIQDTLIKLLESEDLRTKHNVTLLISELSILNPSSQLIHLLIIQLGHENFDLKWRACYTLGEMGKKAATNDVINSLMTALGDENWKVRQGACEALGKIGEKAATNDVINSLMTAFGDKDVNVRKSAYEALGKMGEKAATNDVINRLMTALEGEDANDRVSACGALGKMGEKAVINDVINRLVTALGDENEDVRRRTCEALVEIGKKAVTNVVINRLVTALGDENQKVRQGTCEALEKMGEKAATNDAINSLMTALGDENEDVRCRACIALREMGEKAATNYVINRLVTAVGDKNVNVRKNACFALERMGEKAATNDVINRLVTALGDEEDGVRWNACTALGRIGVKAATNDIINKLVTALQSEHEYVRNNAGGALGIMREKAATNDVVNSLITAVGDENHIVRWRACHTLGAIGEKAITNDVINKLVSALGDEDWDVRQAACDALRAMGEKAATNDVINKLVTVLGDKNVNVRASACYALGSMGEKVATNDLINRLVTALDDENREVREGACAALEKMGEKAVTNDVINRLVSALGDENEYVGQRACVALERMGVKEGTNQMINELFKLLGRESYFVRQDAVKMLKKILFSFSTLTQLSSDAILKLFENIKKGQLGDLRTVHPDEFIKVFLHTKNTVWLPVVAIGALLQGNAVIVTDNSIVIYGNKEPIPVPVPNEEMRRQLIEAFVHQTEELQSSSELLTKSKVVSSVCILM